MKILTSETLKKIVGGLIDPNSICSAGCPDGSTQSRSCGSGTTCSTSGTTVSCGTETTGTDVCKGHT